MTESELRESLAPRIAAKLLARCPRLSLIEADQLAHEVIATVQGAVLAAQSDNMAPAIGMAMDDESGS